MHKNNFYISFGIWIIILPFLGIPGSWKELLVFLSGIFLILVSLGPIILKKLQAKEKSKKKQNKINPQDLTAQSSELRFSAPTDNQIEVEKET